MEMFLTESEDPVIRVHNIYAKDVMGLNNSINMY